VLTARQDAFETAPRKQESQVSNSSAPQDHATREDAPKPVAAAKAAAKKASAKVKPAAKTAAKTAAKSSSKAPAKAKEAAKVAKPSAKPAKAKPAGKVAHASAKPAAKATKPAASKPAAHAANAKSAAHAATTKSAAHAATAASAAHAATGKSAAHAATGKHAAPQTAKPQAKAASKPNDKPAEKPAAKAASATPDAVKPAKPGKSAEATAKPANTRASAKAPVHMPLPAVPTQEEQASRFADRFAPPKPVTRMTVESAPDQQKIARKDPKLTGAWKSKSARDLTEGEVLAMPDEEYMNEKQMEFFRLRLALLKDDLLSNAGETTEHLREDTSIVPDPADRATIEEEHALELRTRDRERKLLKKISQALTRIEGGDYGYCDETGEPIGIARLLARPTATLTLEAQQRRELKQKMFGD
jgi:DnaK suppressor protein